MYWICDWAHWNGSILFILLNRHAFRSWSSSWHRSPATMRYIYAHLHIPNFPIESYLPNVYRRIYCSCLMHQKSRDAMAVVLSDTSAVWHGSGATINGMASNIPYFCMCIYKQAANEKRELERKLQAALDEQSQLEIDLQQHTAASRAEAERLKREMTRLKVWQHCIECYVAIIIF